MSEDTSETDKLIIRLAHELYKINRYSWVSTKALAKHMEGSEEFADIIINIAQLPEAQPYFIISRDESVVRLTESGIQLVQRTSAPSIANSQPYIEQIAQAVKNYAGGLKRQMLDVESVSTIARANQRYVQAVEVRSLEEDIIPTDTPVDLLRRNDHSVHGRVVGQEPDGNVLYIALESEVEKEDEPYKLSVDRAFLLHNLASSIETLPQIPELAQPIIEKQKASIKIAGRDSIAVADELAKLAPKWMRFLWGPPGSGKTYALGRLATKLLHQDQESRILLVAPSNLAADVALEQFLMQAPAAGLDPLVENNHILRYGYPRKTSILSQTALLGPQTLGQQTAEIKTLSARLARAERERLAEAELSVLRAEMLAKQEALRRLVTDHLARCRLVVTTTTQTYLKSSPLTGMVWDSVLVDEVTMVPPAVCFFLGSRAERRVLLAGDPRQLGPIFEENPFTSEAAKRWMGTDVFEMGGISSGKGEHRKIASNDSRLARITGQRRCTATIWKQVAHLYPAVANLVDEKHNNPLRALEPGAGAGMVVLDLDRWTDEDEARCERVYSSWKNEISSTVSLALAQVIRQQSDASIALITPYRAQVRILKNRLREAQQTDPSLSRDVAVGTIHQFQGSEADVVIFDLVDGPGRRKLGQLLTGDAGFRLVTVAVTRARGKCIIIASKKWCRKYVDRDDNPLLWDMVMTP